MGLLTHTTYKRWVVIATDPSGNRGYFAHMPFWSGSRCTAPDIRLAQTFTTRKAAEKAVGTWANNLLTDIEYLTVTHHIRLNNIRRRQQHGKSPGKSTSQS